MPASSVYVRNLVSRLSIATAHVATKNKSKFYPKLNCDVEKMSDKDIKNKINSMILYLQAPEQSHIMFRHEQR